VTLPSFLICVLSALALGLLTALVFSYRNSQTASLSLSIALLSPIVTVVIMLVNGNVGAGLAVAGTFALVRFRSVPGTAREITALFMSVALGLACGMGYVGLAAIFFVVMACALTVLSLVSFGQPKTQPRQLKITIPENLDYDGLFDDLFDKYTLSHELERVKTTNMGTLYELSYQVVLKEPEISKAFLDEIRCRNGNLTVICGREKEIGMM
jgi:hypothetical protein